MATWEILGWGALLLGVIVSRLAVAPDFLYEWDSANYALAMTDYDIFEHRPHAPGSPLFVVLLKLFAWLPGVLPFLAVNLGFSIGALLLMGWLVRQSVGPKVTLAMAVAFAVCPSFWHQGAASTAYTAECFLSVLGAAIGVAVARGQLGVAVGGFLAAFALGIRPGDAFYVPVVFAVGVAVRHPRLDLVMLRNLVVGALAGMVGIVVWAVPMLAVGGGLANYLRATESLLVFQIAEGSILGSGLITGINNEIRLLTYLFDALNVLWIGVLLNAIVGARRTAPHWRTVALVAAWVGPPLAMYMHHLPKSGYSLTLAPIGYVVWALTFGAVSALPIGRLSRVVLGFSGFSLAVYSLMNVVFFLIAVPMDRIRYEDAPDVPITVLPGGFTITADYGVRALQYRTTPQRELWKLVSTLDPQKDLVLYVFGAHDLLRIEQVYHPDQWSIATSEDHGLVFSYPPTDDYPMTFGAFQEGILDPPEIGISWDLPSRIEVVEGKLRIERLGRNVDLVLPKIPRRTIVVYKCPPCGVEVGNGIAPVARRALGAGFDAFEVRIWGFDPSQEPWAYDRPGQSPPIGDQKPG